MLGISVHLDGTELVALHQNRNRAGRKRMRRRKIHRLAQNQIFRRLHIGIDGLIRLLGTTGQPSQRHRRTHQLHEAAARNRIDPLLRGCREFFLHRGLKLRRTGKLIHRTPVLLTPDALQVFAHLGQRHRRRPAFPVSVHLAILVFAHRWQTSQLVSSFGVRILYRSTRK